ncbi:14881_t:CDS:2 [Entrophospora sp. SA101]|nr:14881_t:CDS:2 [Entrophospora sp. SA101]
MSIVIVLKAVDLDLKTTREEPGVHDLPITPLFASFCALCVAEAVATDDESSKKALIFSAAGELFIGKNLAQIICTEVDWVFPKVKNEQVSPGKSMRRQKFLSIEEKQVVVVDDNESHKKVCTELSPLNRPITRTKALQTAMDQVNRKGKGPELPCSNDEEEDLDLDH